MNNKQTLPRINNSSMQMNPQKELVAEVMVRSSSQRQVPNLLGDIKNPEQYEQMSQKQLLREHEKLLKVLKKFQNIIDTSLRKKQKEGNGRPIHNREDVYRGQILNNTKMIENYEKQIKQLENLKKCRKLHQVLDQKNKIIEEMQQVRKYIFDLKNEDALVSKNLVYDRDAIEKQLKNHEKDLKIQLAKQAEYTKKIKQLESQLSKLKTQYENRPPPTHQTPRSPPIFEAKKKQLEDLTKQRLHIQQSIHQNLVAKAKRNKQVAKQIDNCDKHIAQLNQNISQYKEKIKRYQKAMEIIQ